MTERAPAGSLEELRETAIEQLTMVGFHTNLAVDQFAVQAHAGGYYNVRRATAHMRCATGALKLMAEALERAAAEAEQRREDRGLSGNQRRGEAV